VAVSVKVATLCRDCGRALVARTRGQRPADQCGECARGRERKKERAEVACIQCGTRNTAIGLLDDDPTRADALAAYLRR
jgi:hypothetical protein